MSEFECRNGHLVAPSQMVNGVFCPECGERITRMDGLTNGQWRGIEEEWEERDREAERLESEREEEDEKNND